MFGLKLIKYEKQIPHLNLWVAITRHNFKWVTIQIVLIIFIRRSRVIIQTIGTTEDEL